MTTQTAYNAAGQLRTEVVKSVTLSVLERNDDGEWGWHTNRGYLIGYEQTQSDARDLARSLGWEVWCGDEGITFAAPESTPAPNLEWEVNEESLRAEADVAGDSAQVALCDQALHGNPDALASPAPVKNEIPNACSLAVRAATYCIEASEMAKRENHPIEARTLEQMWQVAMSMAQLLSGVLLAVFIGACGLPDPFTTTTKTRDQSCAPDEQQTCPCLGGTQGIQVCDAVGWSFGPCQGCPGSSLGVASSSSSGVHTSSSATETGSSSMFGSSSGSSGAESSSSSHGPALIIQLIWSDALSDLDLHLVRGTAEPRSMTDDCFYTNCKAGFSYSINWGGGDANPVLIQDAHRGGTEEIDIIEPADGDYTAGVEFYDGIGMHQTTAEVKVLVHGVVVVDFSRQLTCAQPVYWEVTHITWVGDQAMLTNVNQMISEPHGGCASGG